MSQMNPPAGIASANAIVDMALATCMCTAYAALHGTLKGGPGLLVFQCGMV